MIEGKFQAFPAAEEKREIYAAEKKERPERKESRLLGRGGSFSKSGNSHKEKKDIKEEQDIKEERQTEPKKKSNREALDGRHSQKKISVCPFIFRTVYPLRFSVVLRLFCPGLFHRLPAQHNMPVIIEPVKQKTIIGQMLVIACHNDEIFRLYGYVFPFVLVRMHHRIHPAKLFPLIV